MLHRAYYRTSTEAQAAAAAAVTKLETDFAARAQATVPDEQKASVGASPVSASRVLSVAALPAGALPSGAAKMSEVVLEFTSPDGRIGRIRTVIPTSVAETIATKAAGTTTVTATTPSTAKIKANVAMSVRASVTGATTISIDSLLEDPVTGKRYKVGPLGYTPTVAGIVEVNVREDVPGSAGDVTHGSPLIWLSSPAEVALTANVYGMAAATVPSGVTLTDPATARTYTTIGSVTVPEHTALAGDSTAEVSIVRSTTDGVADTSSAEVGLELSVVTPLVTSSLVWTRSTSTITVTQVGHLFTSGDPLRISESSDTAAIEVGAIVTAAATWTRSGTVATATIVGHGLSIGDVVKVTVSSDTAAITLGLKTITAKTTDTFNFDCLNGGAASGTITAEIPRQVTRLTADTYSFPCINAGGASGTLGWAIGVGTVAAVASKSEVVVPIDSALTRTVGLSTIRYKTTLAVTIPDTMVATVPFAADAAGAASDVSIGATLTLETPPSGVTAATTVATQSPWAALPESYPGQAFGSPLQFDQLVRKEGAGRWLAVVHTLPLGS